MKSAKACVPVNLPRALTAAAVVVFCLGYGIFYCMNGFRIEAIVFCAIGILFVPVIFIYGSSVSISEDAVTLKFFGYVRRQLPWAQIQEVGIVGERLFLKRKPNKVGARYIYFSPSKMSEKDRFRFALNRSGDGLIYTKYSVSTISIVQRIWTVPIELYNEGDLEL